MEKVMVNLDKRGYPVIIIDDNFQHLARQIKKMSLGTHAFIISNNKISRLYGAKLKKALKTVNISCHFLNVKDSERSKSISEYIRVVNRLSALDTKKRLFLIAFGGGVVGDLTGFIASTYKRGVPYIQVPTTLLGQVDSAIGGKTAIDLPSGKNLVGAFYQPRLVYSNISLLNSLPKRQIKAGLAEVVKYGVITDAPLFKFMEKNSLGVLNLNKKALIHIITACSKIKAKIVENDERETRGLRTILNFGHTIGHALEAASRYANINHGEAVSIGMVGACFLALDMRLISEKDFERIRTLLKQLGLPVGCRNIELKAVLKAFYHDKKFINGKIRMVIPTRISHTIVAENISLKAVKIAIKKVVKR